MIAPYQSIQIPRHIAQATRSAILPMIICLEWVGDYLRTWNSVYGVSK